MDFSSLQFMAERGGIQAKTVAAVVSDLYILEGVFTVGDSVISV